MISLTYRVFHKKCHSVSQKMSLRFTKNVTPFHKKCHSISKKMSPHFTKNDTPFHKKCHLGKPKFYFN